MESSLILRKIRYLIAFFMIGLILSGLTAFPLLKELNLLVSFLNPEKLSSLNQSGLVYWILKVRDGLSNIYSQYPFMAYGTDWLAFAHLVTAIFFIGPLLDPVRNIWIIYSGLAACILVLPLALICGPIREIPFFWRLIDCSFGVFGFIPLYYSLKLTKLLKKNVFSK